MYLTRSQEQRWGDLYGHLYDYDDDEEIDDDNQDDEIDDEIDLSACDAQAGDEFTTRIHYHMNLSRPQRQKDALETVLNIHHGDLQRTAERIDYFADHYKPRRIREMCSEWHWNWHYGWILAREVISHLV